MFSNYNDCDDLLCRTFCRYCLVVVMNQLQLQAFPKLSVFLYQLRN